MNIENIQVLIAKGFLTNVADLDPTTAYVTVGVFQKGNRPSGSSNANAYPSYVLPISEFLKPPSLGYKTYIAKLSQTGINNPPTEDSVGVNTLGTATLSYDFLGTYLITIPGAFPDPTKVFIFFGSSNASMNFDGTFNPNGINGYYNDVNSIGVYTYVFSLNGTPPVDQGMLADGIMSGQTIEIRVYD